MLRLYSRLAGHRVGQVDWDKYMPELYTRFMASFNLPVTYGGSGVHIKHGISGSSCLGSITKWIVSTLGGRSSSQTHLSSLLGAIQSYYHPANSNNSSELLHVLISGLCTYFVDRVHLERHNKKWVTKIPPDKRLTNQDIDMFVMSVRALELLYSLLPGIDVNDIWKKTGTSCRIYTCDGDITGVYYSALRSLSEAEKDKLAKKRQMDLGQEDRVARELRQRRKRARKESTSD